MDLITLQKLSQNPHYKMTPQQKAQLREHEEEGREPMVEFGRPHLHPQGFATHQTEMKKQVRTDKKVLE